jgi:hypothetical protein
MLNIVIKSFNRPYLLEYTILSVQKYVLGKFKIIIVDDGTPEIYLDAIIKKYPFVEITKSKYYSEKSNRILNYTPPNKPIFSKILLPHSDWTEAVNKSNYTLVLEDDQFFINTFDSEKFLEVCNTYNIKLFNLNLGNADLNTLNIIPSIQLNDIVIYSGENILPSCKKFVTKTDMKISSRIKRKLYNVLNNKYYDIEYKEIITLYSLFIVSGVIYNKKYWNDCHIDNKDELNEYKQLFYASKDNIKNKGLGQYAILKKSVVKTNLDNTTLSYNRDTKLDTTYFNIIMNKLWFSGNKEYFNTERWELNREFVFNFLKEINSEFCAPDEWIKYMNNFYATYKDLGFNH